ncbi:MAG: ribose-phosphate pyrophosphokinase [Candidatus Riflebacteria bacterium]|nr:ribose-phosphate pyrophosphokinase [Candidatus Riflebacteria bacterium]
MRNRLKIFSGNAHPELARAICEYLDLPLGKMEVLRFSNDNTFVKVRENVRQCDCFVVQPSCPPVNDGLMELFIIMDALMRASARSITVVMPYFPYSRSDKKDQPRISIAAKLVADLLETAGASRVITMDLHAEQIQGFFGIPVDQLLALPVLCSYFQEMGLQEIVAVAPDAGSAKRTRYYAERLNVPLAILDKRRRGNDDRSEIMYLIGDVRDRTAIIFDDEIATGGSMFGVIAALQANGARKVFGAATHGILCGNAIERFRDSVLEELVVTDTVPIPAEKRISKLKVLSVARLFGEAIKRIHDGTSISALFEH